MAITATSSGNSGSFKLLPAGTYPARCYSMVHIGTIEEEYQGEKKRSNKVRISWEFPTELAIFSPEKGEQPFMLSKTFTISMHEKATLRKFLESWRGQGFSEDEAKSFDITKLLNVPCMVSVTHSTKKNGDVRAEISSVSKMMKGLTIPDAINPILEWNYTDKFDIGVFQSFPDYLKQLIESSAEWKAKHATAAPTPALNPTTVTNLAETPTANEDDDLPF